jgi:hypothetical protein
MSQPPASPHPQEPYSGRPGSGAPQGYPPPDTSQRPAYGSSRPQPQTYGTPSQPQTYGSPPPQQTYGAPPPPDAYPPSAGQSAQYGGAVQYGTPPPVKKSSALKIVLIVAAVIAVLCVGGIGVAFFAAKDKVADVVDAAKISVVAPDTLAGREKVTDPTLTSSVSELDSALGKVPGATGSVGAVYGEAAEQDLVMIAAASTISGTAQGRFEEFTRGMGEGGLDIKNLTDTTPGPLGGIARCGDSKVQNVPMAICVWSDNGSLGMIAMMFKEKADLEKEFVTMRGQIEQKS